MDPNEYPAMANWGGWRSESDGLGGIGMKQWTQGNTADIQYPGHYEYRPYTANEIDMRRMEYERQQREAALHAQQAAQQQMQYSNLQSMFDKAMLDPEKALLEAIHKRGKFYKMLVLQELSIA